MQDHRNAGAPPEPGTPEHRMQRVLLLELLTDAPPEPEALAALAARLRELAAGGCAVLVATHDAEFAAAFAERVVLLADGRVIADGAPAELLSGGWYFATETARILGSALLPDDGAAQLRARMQMEVPSR